MPYVAGMHYRRSAQSRKKRIPLILIHGAGGSYLHWPAEIRRLPGEDVLAIDLPGHGDSSGDGKETIEDYVASVLDFLNYLKIDLAVIAGHSMGSAIAQILSLDYPERIPGLILIGAGAKLRVHPKLIEYSSSEDTYPETVAQVMEWAFSPEAEQRVVELAGERMAELPANILLNDFKACGAFDMRDHVGKIFQPTLIICGEDDQMTPVRFSQYLADNIPGSRLNVIPKAGHMVMLEQPGRAADLVQGFMEEINQG